MQDLSISKLFQSPLCLLIVLYLLCIPLSFISAQVKTDPLLLKEIFEIQAVDDHSHVFPFIIDTAGQTKSDAVLGTAPFDYPVRLRVDNPEYINAWQQLYGYQYNNMENAKDALDKKRLLKTEKGELWPGWILQKVNIQTTFVNLPKLGAGQQNEYFHWVPPVDALVIPFVISGDSVKIKKNINQLLTELKLSILPKDLNSYISSFLIPLLRKWKEEGVLAIKIALAYQRSLNFNKVNDSEAGDTYAGLLRGDRVTAERYRNLQDYFFFTLVREAGTAGLAVQIHTGIGADPYFNISGSNPLLLENVLNDPEFHQTNFVLIHGGWPFEKEGGVLAIKPNVYIDFSAQTFLRSVRALSETLRQWLEWYPEKILFGTDAYPDPGIPLSDWEEKIWLSNYSAREALAMALTSMMMDEQITKDQALKLAQMVLRENAIKLYKLKY